MHSQLSRLHSHAKRLTSRHVILCIQNYIFHLTITISRPEFHISLDNHNFFPCLICPTTHRGRAWLCDTGLVVTRTNCRAFIWTGHSAAMCPAFAWVFLSQLLILGGALSWGRASKQLGITVGNQQCFKFVNYVISSAVSGFCIMWGLDLWEKLRLCILCGRSTVSVLLTFCILAGL